LPTAHAAPVSNGFYAEGNEANPCGSLKSCSATFAAIPAAKTVIITNVTCFMRTSDAPNIPLVSLYTKPATYGTKPTDALVPTFLGNFTSDTHTYREYSLNNAVTHIVLAGRVPEIGATTFNAAGKFVHLVCSISGLIR